MSSHTEFESLIHLLDDDTPQVRESVTRKLREYGGDVSEELAVCMGELKDSDVRLLSEILRPVRRESLLEEWIVPQGGFVGMEDDWEALEARLRLISDFLHDGVTLRESLSDALDGLAEEAKDAVEADGVNGLRIFLFESGKFLGNHENYNQPENSDLCWVMLNGKSNPLGLCVLFILVARRLGLEVDGVNFPNHFICRVEHEGKQFLVDCFNGGKVHDLLGILNRREEIATHALDALTNAATPGEILVRWLRNLELSFGRCNSAIDAELVRALIRSLEP